MTDTELRWLMFSALGAMVALPPLTSVGKADDVARATENLNIERTLKIVSAREADTEASEIVIAPAGQTDGENNAPILIAPEYDAPSKNHQDAKKPTDKTNPAGQKGAKTPVATETASRKAREEWQKQRPAEGQKRKPHGQTSKSSENDRGAENATTDERDAEGVSVKTTSSKAEKAAAGEKKRAMTAKDAAKAAGSASANASKTTPATATKADSGAAVVPQKDTRSYREIYASIPFSRSEYDANPAYRHLATMEIMLGQLHPVIVAPVAPPQTQRPVTIHFLPVIRSGYRVWSSYPWH